MATIVVVVFTASRAAVGFSAFGIGLIYLLSALTGLTGRKMLFAALGVLGLAVIGPVVIFSFEQRFEAAPLTEDQYDERAAFNRAATYIIEDHPFGVGSNHYVHVAKNEGYSERAGVAPFEGNRNNIVHNAYLLAAAETGYLGLLSFAIVLLVPLFVTVRAGWRYRDSAEGHLLLGFGVAMAVIYVHSFFEWVIFAREVQYLLFMTMGMSYGIVLRLRTSAPVRRNRGSGLGLDRVMVRPVETPQSR
nr:O-antigen ligase family protein [Devosia faecipullorum]